MNRGSRLLQAIDLLWDDLPDSLKAALPRYRAQLAEECGDEISGTVLIVLDLFSRHPAAHKRLLQTMNDPTLLVHKTVMESSNITGDCMRAGMLAEHKPVIRYTDISCPRRVWIKAPRVSVVVRLTLKPSGLSAAVEELELDKNLPVRVYLDAPAFELLNGNMQEIEIIPDADSPPLVFDLRPQEIGHKHIVLDFYQDGNHAGTASVPVEISAQEVSAHTSKVVPQVISVTPRLEPPDFTLTVSYERGHSELRFRLQRAGEFGEEFAPVKLQCDPQAYAADLFKGLCELQRRRDVQDKLRKIGYRLWSELIPKELRDIYADERRVWKDKTLVLISDEPYFPWELVWPYGSGWKDEAPWSVTLRLTRWLRRDAQGNGHRSAPAMLSLEKLICIAPKDMGLPGAQSESSYLRELVKAKGFSDLGPTEASYKRVMGLLEAGEYTWMHAATHGNVVETVGADTVMWLKDGEALKPGDFVGPEIEGHIAEARPAFVFNACHSGREAWGLTGLAGWANQLIKSGAGLFVAPLWTIGDQTALAFSRVFYGALLDGDTVAEAARQAREAIKDRDASWLAYSVYAHPNARVSSTSN